MKRLAFCLLLVTLVLCGCAGKQDTQVPDYDAITLPEEGLLCCIYDRETGEEQILTGNEVYDLLDTLHIAMTQSNRDIPMQHYPEADELSLILYFYTEDTDTAAPETEAEGFTVSGKRFYGYYAVYPGGYISYGQSPLHSYAEKYYGDTDIYEIARGYMK